MENNIKTNFQKAQEELDVRISNYYSRNEDGGNYEEKYIISQKVARAFELDPIETELLIF